MLLNDVMDFKEAGQRVSCIIDQWNTANWEDTDFVERKADITNKDILALLITVTELKHVTQVAVEKVRHYRQTAINYGVHKNSCAKVDGRDHRNPCTCGLTNALNHKIKKKV